ncbi:transcriptional regulator [Staphylococcus capitis]|nr:transcriptional regulator [Staphylococcus capitis]
MVANGYSDNILVKLFISEIVHTEDSFLLKLYYKFNFATEPKKLPDINQRMLIRQLKELEKDMIITRTVYPIVPPKVEYRLTDIGLSLENVVYGICEWGDEYLKLINNGN